MSNTWYLLSPLSLLLGLAAWALPLMAMSRRLRLGSALAASSLCCSIPLVPAAVPGPSGHDTGLVRPAGYLRRTGAGGGSIDRDHRTVASGGCRFGWRPPVIRLMKRRAAALARAVICVAAFTCFFFLVVLIALALFTPGNWAAC